MLKQRARIVNFTLFCADGVAATAGFLVAYFLRSIMTGLLSLYPIGEYFYLPLLFVLFWAILSRPFKLYASHRTESLSREVGQVVWCAASCGALLFAAMFALKYHHVSRLLTAMFVISAAVLISIERIAVRLIARYVRSKGYNVRHLIIVGSGTRAKAIATAIEEHKHWGLHLLGFVSDNPKLQGRDINGYPVLGKNGDILNLLNQHVVDELIFAMPRRQLEKYEDIFLLCQEMGIKTRVAANFFPRMVAKVGLESLNGIPLLTFSTTPTNEYALLIKRALDIMIASIALVLLSPLMLAVAAAIKLTSIGPIFFKQTRVGQNGRLFTLYKFRSMYRDAEAKRKELEHLNELDGPVFKIKKDPRITPVGRFIRKFSIDELPQLWNVLKGDMSIVGPRPPTPEEVKKYKRWQRRRLSMKPGITCLWQVNGRNKIAFDQWVKLDLYYIDNWSLWLDTKILLKTIPAVISGRGAS